MKHSSRKKNGLIPVVIILVLAALSVGIAWFAQRSSDPQPNNGNTRTDSQSTVVFSSENTDSSTRITDSGTSHTVSTETDLPTQSDTDTDSHSATDTDTDKVTDTSSVTTSTIRDSDVLGSITPPPDGPNKKRIAFTFDDGPHGVITKGIADEFAKYGGHCTYFVVGNRVHGNQLTAMQYAYGLGNEIAIHGYTHTNYYNKCSTDLYNYELTETAKAIMYATGKAPTLMRPPGGSITNPRVADCPYSVILWNVDTKDWYYKKESQKNIDAIVQNILTAATEGDIVLMHDIYYNTLEAVKIALPILKEQGYEFVTVSELLGDEMQAGKKYNKAY